MQILCATGRKSEIFLPKQKKAFERPSSRWRSRQSNRVISRGGAKSNSSAKHFPPTRKKCASREEKKMEKRVPKGAFSSTWGTNDKHRISWHFQRRASTATPISPPSSKEELDRQNTCGKSKFIRFSAFRPFPLSAAAASSSYSSIFVVNFNLMAENKLRFFAPRGAPHAGLVLIFIPLLFRLNFPFLWKHF